MLKTRSLLPFLMLIFSHQPIFLKRLPHFSSQKENDDEIIDEFIDGCSLLHLACQTADIGMVELLLHHGARINAPDTRGQTSLHHSIIREIIVITKLLLRRPRNEVGSAALQP